MTKVRVRPKGHVNAAARGVRSRFSVPWPRRKPLPMTIKYRGGDECWYEIRVRGETIRRPGHLALHDVMCDIYGVPWWE